MSVKVLIHSGHHSSQAEADERVTAIEIETTSSCRFFSFKYYTLHPFIPLMCCCLTLPWRLTPPARRGGEHTAPDVHVPSEGHWWRQTEGSSPSAGGLAPSLSARWGAGRNSFIRCTDKELCHSLDTVLESWLVWYLQVFTSLVITLDIELHLAFISNVVTCFALWWVYAKW